MPEERIAAAINPKGEKPYSGPTGTVRGVVRIKGDPPPATDVKFPEKCTEGVKTYGKLFRTGEGNTLADALVAVTGYSGFVPAREDARKVTITNCAFSKRTFALAFGQRLEINNLDEMESYMPYLDGAPVKAIMVAMPKGASVKQYPSQPGHYLLRDQLPKPFMTADVYVLSYATHDVTGVDGVYQIPAVPVGKARVSAFLPAIDRTVNQDIDVKEGDNVFDLTLEYSAPADAKHSSPKNRP